MTLVSLRTSKGLYTGNITVFRNVENYNLNSVGCIISNFQHRIRAGVILPRARVE